jgi:hypothetical protein
MTDVSTAPTQDADGRGSRFWIVTAVVAFAIIVAGVLVYLASYAAFSTDTETGPSSFSAGTIDLSNDKEASAVFDVTDLSPGSTGSAPIVVHYEGGDISSLVRLYADSGDSVADQSLAADLDLVITATGATGTPWTGTLAEFQALTDFSQGVLEITMAGTQDQTYTVQYTVADTASMAESAAVTFVWEAQSLP